MRKSFSFGFCVTKLNYIGELTQPFILASETKRIQQPNTGPKKINKTWGELEVFLCLCFLQKGNYMQKRLWLMLSIRFRQHNKFLIKQGWVVTETLGTQKLDKNKRTKKVTNFGNFSSSIMVFEYPNFSANMFEYQANFKKNPRIS